MKEILILIVDDDHAHRYMLGEMLHKWGWKTMEADDGDVAVELVKKRSFDALLMDVRMARMNGMEALKQINLHNPSIPVVIMTAYSSIDAAVKAIKLGAHDYLTKPLDFERLKETLEKSFQQFIPRSKIIDSESLSEPPTEFFENIIGKSEPINQLLDLINIIAPTEATVLITGESGTGKELVASAIHAASTRKDASFVKVNCAALVENLLESELFGHEKGAFTGADKKRDGKFVQADKGTIFLDEVGEMSAGMQAKLLRVLQEQEVQMVGSQKQINVNVRVLAATNRILETEVAEGRFREDLFYRLNVVSVQVPSLRERNNDIPLLANFLIKKLAKKNHRIVKGITPECMNYLVNYPWPGNVRELENALERSIILMRGEFLEENTLPITIINWIKTKLDQGNNINEKTEPSSLEDAEKMVIARTLAESNGNKSETARRLKITRKTLLSKLKKFNLL
jgi:two-component system, NtrC family, response regulator HydG